MTLRSGMNLRDVTRQLSVVLAEYRFRLKNTHTSEGNKEMEKTLTYFAIRQGKPAMGVEASKEYPTHKRALQHLRFLESMMQQVGINFSRSFALSERAIYEKMGKNIQLAL